MPLQSIPLKDAIVETLTATIQANTIIDIVATTEDLEVETTTFYDDEATTEYPSYIDDDNDFISNSLALSFLG